MFRAVTQSLWHMYLYPNMFRVVGLNKFMAHVSESAT